MSEKVRCPNGSRGICKRKSSQMYGFKCGRAKYHKRTENCKSSLIDNDCPICITKKESNHE